MSIMCIILLRRVRGLPLNRRSRPGGSSGFEDTHSSTSSALRSWVLAQVTYPPWVLVSSVSNTLGLYELTHTAYLKFPSIHRTYDQRCNFNLNGKSHNFPISLFFGKCQTYFAVLKVFVTHWSCLYPTHCSVSAPVYRFLFSN